MTSEELREFSSGHLLYEIEMFFFVRELLEKYASPATFEDNVIKNALIESFTIHLRNLATFLYNEPKRAEDVTAERYVQDVKKWRAARGDMPDLLKTAIQRTGKEIAHLTTHRHSSDAPEGPWSPRDLTELVAVPLKKFVASTPAERLDWRIRMFGAEVED